MSKPIIAICASASTYDRVIPFSDELSKHGVAVRLPAMAERMKRSGNTNAEHTIDWQTDPRGYDYKAKLIHEHFAVIESADAILVPNFEKNGKPNYIGGNVLMEMTVAFYLHKPIFILFGAPDNSPLIDEIMGMLPVFLHGRLDGIPTHLGERANQIS